jgi:hypothetical protein
MGYVAHLEDRRGAYRVLVGKPEGKRPLGKPMCGWEDKIKMDLHTVGWGGGGGMDWIDLAQNMNRWQVLVNVVMNSQVPETVRNILISRGTVEF